MKTLEELADYYATDKRKSDHNYIQFYEKYFDPIRESVQNILEIGILNHPDKLRRPFQGASILMWNDYFFNATIYGADIVDHSNMEKFGEERISIHIINQGDRFQLKSLMENKIKKEMDIIIDDGSHWMHHQQISFASLFKYLKSGGIYVIEDLHTSHPQPPLAPMSSQLSPDDTLTQDMFHNFVKNKKMISMFMKELEIKYLEENIKECILEKGVISEIAFIIKK